MTTFLDIWQRISAARNDKESSHSKDQIVFAILAIEEAKTRLTEAQIYNDYAGAQNVPAWRKRLSDLMEDIINNQS